MNQTQKNPIASMCQSLIQVINLNENAHFNCFIEMVDSSMFHLYRNVEGVIKAGPRLYLENENMFVHCSGSTPFGGQTGSMKCEGFLPGDGYLLANDLKKYHYLQRKDIQYPFDSASAFIDWNGSVHFWIIGGRYFRKNHPIEIVNETKVISLDQWKHVKGKELGSSISWASPGLKYGPKTPFTIFDHCIAQVNLTFFYIIGGRDEHINYQSSVWSYDSIMDNWMKIQVDDELLPCHPWRVGYQTACSLLVSIILITYDKASYPLNFYEGKLSNFQNGNPCFASEG